MVCYNCNYPNKFSKQFPLKTQPSMPITIIIAYINYHIPFFYLLDIKKRNDPCRIKRFHKGLFSFHILPKALNEFGVRYMRPRRPYQLHCLATSSVSLRQPQSRLPISAPLRSVLNARPPDVQNRSALNACHWQAAPPQGKALSKLHHDLVCALDEFLHLVRRELLICKDCQVIELLRDELAPVA